MLANSPSAEISNNADQNRFELRLNGDLVGILAYYEFDSNSAQRRPGGTRIVSFMHTVITDDFGHRGLAGVMVRGSLEQARRYGWKVRPVCTYVQRFLAGNSDFRDVVVALENSPEQLAR